MKQYILKFVKKIVSNTNMIINWLFSVYLCGPKTMCFLSGKTKEIYCTLNVDDKIVRKGSIARAAANFSRR